MQKNIIYYIRDAQNSKECLSRDDLIRDVEKLVDYFASNPQLNSVIVTVEGDVSINPESDPEPIEVDFASLKTIPDEPLDSDLVPPYDPQRYTSNISNFKKAGI